MNIHEYQSKKILRDYGVNTPEGILANNVDEAVVAAKSIKSDFWVLKAQVHAGGRGKAGGVKIAKSIEEVKEIASKMFGMTLITKQTGEEGKKVNKVYVEASSNIVKEYYLSLVLDRNSSSIAIIASTEGGIDIEEVAEKTPDKIVKIFVNTAMGLRKFHLMKLGYSLDLSKEKVVKLGKIVESLYRVFVDKDVMQIELNPLVEVEGGEFIVLDAKLNFDDNALYRNKDIEDMRDISEENPQEVEAKNFNLSYIKMDGNIGCMVNGAGLAMATMDIISSYGQRPANFLDVGGGADVEKVTEAFKIILKDKNVSAILINIFGGIMKCDIIAEGIISAAKVVNISVPVVVRLEGTNADIGKAILERSAIGLASADDLDDAARKVVNFVSIGK